MGRPRTYNPSLMFLSEWRKDLGAGLTTAIMLIPQAMAYAMLAGLPPIAGLYASVVPLVAYALSGSSNKLAIGPVAMDSLLTATTVGAIAATGTTEYAMLAALLAFLVGIIQVGLSVVRAGFLVNFLSRPIVSGFTSAAALIIASSQIRSLFGLTLPRTSSVFETLAAVVQNIGDVHLLTLAIGAASIAALSLLKKYRPKWPRALLVVAGSSIAAFAFGFESQGVALVGPIPAGFPSPHLPSLNLDTWMILLPGALTIAFVAFMEGISVSTKLAERDGSKIYPNREFFALGLANLSAGIFSAFPVAGGFSRTAVNADAGARTKLAGFITAVVVAITVSFLTPALYFIPKATLAAIIMTAVAGLIDFAEPRRLFQIKRIDLALLLATFALTLTLGIQQGILSGVGLSLLVLVVRTTRPHMAVLGRLPDSEVYRNVLRFDDAIQIPGLLIVRLDAQLYFGNVSFLRHALQELEEERANNLYGVIFDASGINQLDSSAEKALSDLERSYAERGITLYFADLKGPVRDVLHRSGLMKQMGPRAACLRVHDAVVDAQKKHRLSLVDGDDSKSEDPPPTSAARHA